MLEYVHEPLDEPVVAIGGNYRFVEEKRLFFQGEEILYLIGVANMDTSCCCAGGCGYALVKGAVNAWKYRETADGYAISRIDRVTDPATQNRISQRIRSVEILQQVLFS